MTIPTKPERGHRPARKPDAWAETPRNPSEMNPARDDLHLLVDIPAIILAAWTIDADGASLIQELER